MAAKDHPQSLTRAARAALLVALAAPLPGTAGAQRVTFADLASAPAAMARRRAAMDQLASTLSTAIGSTGRSGTWGVLVVSLTNGDTLFGFNPDRQLLPASTMKLFTSALALDQFGPSGRFETKVLRSGTLRTDGTLDGDLVLREIGRAHV